MKKLLLIIMLLAFIGAAEADYIPVWPITRGGTGQITASAALSALGGLSSTNPVVSTGLTATSSTSSDPYFDLKSTFPSTGHEFKINSDHANSELLITDVSSGSNIMTISGASSFDTNSGLIMNSAGVFAFASGTTNPTYASSDTGISRDSAGVIDIGNGFAQDTSGSVKAASFIGALTGNASTVTTNANLTGPITSVGNATSIASQTGTGTTFVTQASPSLTTPNINVATGTSLVLTGASANTLAVGANGSTNPALQVNAATASSATGIAIVSAAAGAGVTVNTISSGSNENLTINALGTGALTLNTSGAGSLQFQTSGVNRLVMQPYSLTFAPTAGTGAGVTRFGYTGASDTGLTAATEAISTWFNIGQTRQHATGAIALQRDFRITGTTHSFVGASIITDAAAFAIEKYGQSGTNGTITNASGLLIQAQAVAGTVTNAYGINVVAPTGAGTTNAALLAGDGTRTVRLADGTNAITATGAVSASSTVTGTAFIPSSSTIPTDGLYKPAANTSGIADNSQPVQEYSGVASAVDYMLITNAATANPANILYAPTGTDTNIGENHTMKGVGLFTILYTGADSAGNNGPFTVDASGSTLSGNPAFKIVLPASGSHKAFQFSNGTDTTAWASFQYDLGGTGLAGLALGAGGSSTRDLFLYRSAANTLNLATAAGNSSGTLNAGAINGGADLTVTSGNISLATAGKGLVIKSGSNARIGTGTLTAGTVTIANTSVTANTRVFLTDTSSSTTNVGSLTVSAISAGTSFTVTSTLALDVSTFNWMLVESQ